MNVMNHNTHTNGALSSRGAARSAPRASYTCCITPRKPGRRGTVTEDGARRCMAADGPTTGALSGTRIANRQPCLTRRQMRILLGNFSLNLSVGLCGAASDFQRLRELCFCDCAWGLMTQPLVPSPKPLTPWPLVTCPPLADVRRRRVSVELKVHP